MRFRYLFWLSFYVAFGAWPAMGSQQEAGFPIQVAQLPPDRPIPEVIPDRPLEERLPAAPLPQLPPVEDLLTPDSRTPDSRSTDLPSEGSSGSEETFVISGIRLVGGTVFTEEDFAELFARYIGRPITFDDLLQLRSAVTQRYVDEGFVTSGAFIPPQTLAGGIVTVQVVEGRIAEIKVTGTRRLSPDYIRSRLGLAAQPPINVETLLAGLQRLQVDPLIAGVSADLQAGISPGTSVLQVMVAEAASFDLSLGVDNSRPRNTGSVRRLLAVNEGNLSGLGDRANFSYTNTDGSNSIDVSYAIPVSPYNTRVNLEAGISESRVIDDLFSVLDISADAYYVEVGISHPLIETPTQAASIALALTQRENQTRLGLDDIGPFPLTPGADDQGRTRITALRFSQSWTQRSQQQVFAVRSQFNLGLGWFNATQNEGDVPDGQFFSWRGQGQWVRLLGKDSRLLLRGDVQLATGSLLSSEQFGLGGQQTVRGYPQDTLLRDNGILLSAEATFPIIRLAANDVIQVVPFLDAGAAWNAQNTANDSRVLVGTGIGLLWQQGDHFTTRLDWGIPLVNLADMERSRRWQDNGLYFSVQYDLF